MVVVLLAAVLHCSAHVEDPQPAYDHLAALGRQRCRSTRSPDPNPDHNSAGPFFFVEIYCVVTILLWSRGAAVLRWLAYIHPRLVDAAFEAVALEVWLRRSGFGGLARKFSAYEF